MLGLGVSIWPTRAGGQSGGVGGGSTHHLSTYYIYGFGTQLVSGGPADVVAPVLTSPTDSKIGSATANLGVTTDDSTGTLYVVVTTSSTPPSAAQVKAGTDNVGVAARYAGNQAITSSGTKTFVANGLAESTAYTTFFMHEDAVGNQSSVSAADGFTTDPGPDSVAPALTNPIDNTTGSSTASLTVDTDEGNGTLYVVATISATPPSKARVKLGQDSAGAAATYASNQAIASTGTKSFSANGFTSSTAYTAFFMQEDATGNQSTVSAANGFTTNAPAMGGSSSTYYIYGF